MTPPKPVRSPSYPNASLSEAIAGVRKIEKLYRSAPVDREVAAKLIGYSSLSGPANKALAALAQYGLVERAGKGEMRVTSRAQAILHPNSDSEQHEHLRAAALEPQLYRELHERFPNMTPPESGVTTYLNRQGFNQTAVRPAAKAYLQTLLFLEESGASESHGGGGDEGADSSSSAIKPDDSVMEHTAQSAPTYVGRTIPAAVDSVERAASQRDLIPNEVYLDIRGSREVHIEGILDYDGILELEEKLKAVKMLLKRRQQNSADADEGENAH